MVLWVLGRVDRSADVARELLIAEEGAEHPFSFCTTLAWCGCIVPLLVGDLATADELIARLKLHAERHGLTGFHARGTGFEGQLCAARGQFAKAERLLRSSLKVLRRVRSGSMPIFLTSLAELLANAGHIAEGLAAAVEAVERIERTGQLWWLAEALRIKGVTLQLSQRHEAAEDQFRQALDWAGRQGALSWELRAAVNLAQLLRHSGHSADAVKILQPVHDRFTEGFETLDLTMARQVLKSLITEAKG